MKLRFILTMIVAVLAIHPAVSQAYENGYEMKRSRVGRPGGSTAAGSLVLTQDSTPIPDNAPIPFVGVAFTHGGITTNPSSPNTYLQVPQDGVYLLSISVVDSNLTSVFGAHDGITFIPGLSIDTSNLAQGQDGVLFTQSVVTPLTAGAQISIRNRSGGSRELVIPGDPTDLTRAALSVVMLSPL